MPLILRLGAVMKRREFITLIGGAAAMRPFAGRGQSSQMMRLGIISNFAANDRDRAAEIDAVRQRLLELGWQEGRNIRIDFRSSDGDPNRLRTNAAELVGLKPNVILAFSTPPVAALQQATRTIPIVFVGANDPVGS